MVLRGDFRWRKCGIRSESTQNKTSICWETSSTDYQTNMIVNGAFHKNRKGPTFDCQKGCRSEKKDAPTPSPALPPFLIKSNLPLEIDESRVRSQVSQLGVRRKKGSWFKPAAGLNPPPTLTLPLTGMKHPLPKEETQL